MSHGHIGYMFHQPIIHNQSPDEPWPYWICVASANQTQPCLLMSHSHIGYVFHQPIKHNHILQCAMAILDMCFISQSYTTISPDEPWPNEICVTSANHYGFLFHYISANQKLHFQWCQYWMPHLNDSRKLF